MKKQFTKEGIQIANQHMIKYSTTVSITKMKIKSWIRYHNLCTRIAKIFHITTQNAGQDVEKLDVSFIADGNVK